MKAKTARKPLTAALALSMALCACAEITFTYTLADGGATITGASNVETCLDIPETIDGYPVVAIGDSAFNFELDLEHLTIPSSVTNIGKHAFSLCHGMEEIIIPDSVKNIGDYAFYKCYDTEWIEIGSGVRTIGHWAFGECYALENLSIAHGVENIGEYAFGYCYSLESVTLPSSVTNVKWGAFAEIPALQTAYLPAHLKDSISQGAFQNSPNVSVKYYNCETPVAPQSVFDVAATDDLNGKIRVTWGMDEYSEVSSFQIYRAMRPHFRKAVLVAEVPAGGELAYEDTDVSSDYTYCYWVRPVNDIFSGVVSGVATGYCEDPREELTFYVDASNGDDGNTGLAKDAAFKTLQAAVDRAGNWDTIIVADGVYAPIETHNRRIVIESENGYKNAIIDGGGESVCAWLGGVDAGPDEPPSYTWDNWSGNKTILRGFTLRNGSGRCGAGAIGGTLENCLIVNNVVEATTSHPSSPDGFGGGAYNSILRNCTIADNSSLPLFSDDDTKWGGLGGGCWNCKLYGCIEWGNTEDPENSESAMWWGGSNNEYDEFCFLDDPVFADAASGDYRLTSASPCVVDGVATAGCETEAVEPKTLYVDAANGDDTADGLSKANAVKTLQTAIDRAVNGDTVLVADGTYTPIHVGDKRITIESENGYKTTIIDGGGTNACASFWHLGAVYPDFIPSTNATLRGLTLRNGYEIHGAGVSGGTLEYCLIVGNVAYNEEPGHNATFYYGQGGGAYCSSLRHCTIVNNTAELWPGYEWEEPPQTSGGEGGGVYGCTLENCIVYGNDGAIAPDASYSEYSSDSLVGVDPLFVDAASGDYRLTSASPCVVDGVATAGCETEVVSGTVPELSQEQATAWISEDLATRYAKSGESAADYQNRFEAKFGPDPVAAMAMPTDKKDAQGNNMYVWQDYVAGTDPTDTNSVFTAKIDLVDGAPVITWEPELPSEQTALRSYTIYGKTNLTDRAWHSPTNEASRFFKVGVEMK